MADILVVTDTFGPTADDTNLINALEGAGHIVTLGIEDDDLPSVGFDAIIVTESGSAGSPAVQTINTCALPVMMFETSVDTASLATAALTTNTSGTTWDLSAHALNTGHPDPLTVRASANSHYGVAAAALPAGAESLAVAPGTTHHVAWLIDAGNAQVGGNAPNRRVAMGLITTRLSDMVAGADSGPWFLGVVTWLAEGSGSGIPEGSTAGAFTFAGLASGHNRPGVPANLQAVAVSGSQVDLSWDAVTGVSGYDIERDGVVIVFDHPTTSYSDTGLTAEVEYDYRVRAVE